MPRCSRKPRPSLRRALRILICLAASPACAGETHLLHYTARLHGIKLLDITFCMALEGATYTAALDARTLGLAEFLAHARSEAHARGTLDGLRVKPAAYDEHGRLNGENHSVAITYPAGDPVLQHMTPSQEKIRLPIPPALLPGSMDGLSAIILETLVATRTGACQGQALVYDGFQLRRGTTHTAGTEVLKPSPLSIFAGPALRCETESRMLAGYMKDKAIPPQAKPRYSTGWFGRLNPSGPLLPLKLSFDADFLGDIIVDLDHASTPPPDACAARS